MTTRSPRTERQTRCLLALGVHPEQLPPTMGAAGALIARIKVELGQRKSPKSDTLPIEEFPREWWEEPEAGSQICGWLAEQVEHLGPVYAYYSLSPEEIERLGLTLA